MLLRSTDLFYFQLLPQDTFKLNDLKSSDHITLYPTNLDKLVDFIYRILNFIDDYSPIEVKKIFKNDVDLSKPVSSLNLLQ
jgi:hypothetical protein